MGGKTRQEVERFCALVSKINSDDDGINWSQIKFKPPPFRRADLSLPIDVEKTLVFVYGSCEE